MYWKNHNTKQRLSKQKGYWDESIKNFETLRRYIPDKIPNFFASWIKLFRFCNPAEIKKYFQKQHVLIGKQVTLKHVERRSYLEEIQIEYWSPFWRDGDVGWIHHPLSELQDKMILMMESIFNDDEETTSEHYVQHLMEFLADENIQHVEMHKAYIQEFVESIKETLGVFTDDESDDALNNDIDIMEIDDFKDEN